MKNRFYSLRGSYLSSRPYNCRSAYRNSATRDGIGGNVGFRIVKKIGKYIE